MRITNKMLERICKDQLEDISLEEFFEQFDLTPFEIIELCFHEGMLNPDILEGMLPADA